MEKEKRRRRRWVGSGDNISVYRHREGGKCLGPNCTTLGKGGMAIAVTHEEEEKGGKRKK
jgi:shikimate 5-dehydrogenase